MYQSNVSSNFNRHIAACSISLEAPYGSFSLEWGLPYTVRTAQVTHLIRQDMIDDLVVFRKLSNGWLGAGSQAIPAETTDRVSSVAQLLENVDGLPNPELTPNANGTISLEWESKKGELYIEFGKTRISGFLRVEDFPTVYFKDLSSLQPIFYTEIRNLLFPVIQTPSITTSGAAFNGYSLP